MKAGAGDSSGYLLGGRAIRDKAVDVLVLGGGMAGILAALAAKSDDLSVAIAEPANILGGQGTAGGVAGFCGDTVRTNGEFAELVRRLTAIGRIDPYDPNEDRRAYDLEQCAFVLQEMVAARGIEILLHTSALDARREGDRVSEVLLLCGPTLLRVRPKVVIDATGNCVVATALGLPTIGPGANVQLPMSLYFTLWNTGAKIEPFLPEGCPRWERDDDLPMTSLHLFASGKIEVKMKVVGFDAADGESLARAEIHARRQMMGLVYYLQTRGYHGRHAVNDGRPLDTYTLASVSRQIGQRQGRLIVGEYSLTEADTLRGRRFDDAVAVGTYHHDYHWPDTEKRAGTGITTMVEPYHIPLRAMIAKDMANLLAPGRSMSGDQMAFSSYRVMATCAQSGFAAGKAAQMAARSGVRLQDLPIKTLRAAITAGGQSLDLSDYGDYIRVLRFADETVPIAGRPAALALVRGRDAVTTALWGDAAQPRVLMVTCRADGGWAAPRAAAMLPAGIRSLAATRLADGRMAVVVAHDGGRGISLLLSDDGGDWRVATTVDRADNVELAGVALGQAQAAGQSGLEVRITTGDGRAFRLRLDSAGAAIVGDLPLEPIAQAAFLDAVTRPDGTTAAVLAHATGARAALLAPDGAVTREMAVDIAPGAPCRVIATPVGMALCWAAPGALRFMEFPPERMAEPGQPPPDPKALAIRPYREHLHLDAG